MKTTVSNTEQHALQVLRSRLERVPFIRVEDSRLASTVTHHVWDLQLRVSRPGSFFEIVAQVKTNGQPRFARNAVYQLTRYLERNPDAFGVFIAPYISNQSAEICTTEGIGHLDFAGNCRLVFEGVYIEEKGNPNPDSEQRYLRSLYAPKAERVLRVLLLNPKTPWKMKDLAGESHVSLGQASNVKKLLLDKELISSQKAGFILFKPEELLEEWTARYTFRRSRQSNYYSLKTPGNIEADIAELCSRKGIRYALAGFSAAARRVSRIRYQKVMAYVENPSIIAAELKLEQVSSGANVVLMEPYDSGIFIGAEQKEGAEITSSIQTFLDLRNYRGRGEDVALV
ncbi:MAG: type IV toxin-antitoxin system AbiEi family antitoxin, partial [Candidatus Latescibacterota bacterium]